MSLVPTIAKVDREGFQRLHDIAVTLGASCRCVDRGRAKKRADDLHRFNPNHYGPGERGGQFAPADDAGSGSSSASAPPKSVQVASNDQGAANGADADAQVAQRNAEVPLGIATARAVLAREVAEKRMSQAEADRLLEQIGKGDADAIARVSVALRIRSGIPENWKADSTDREGGIYYRNPENPRYGYARIMPGSPQNSNPAQREPYVVDQKSGRFLTQSGDRIEATMTTGLTFRSRITISTKGDAMADDEIITSETITTTQWLRFIKSVIEDFAADRDVQEKAWLSGSSDVRSPTEMICTLMNDFSFRSIVAEPSSRELSDLSAAQRASCSRFSDLVTAFVKRKKGRFLERDVINDPEWDKIRIAAKALFKELYP